MGKIDDMRRHREALFALREGRAAAPVDDVLEAPPVADPADAGRRPRRLGGGRGGDVEEGTCSVCGKVRPMHGGIIAVHQKGLGSVCPGSRKAAG